MNDSNVIPLPDLCRVIAANPDLGRLVGVPIFEQCDVTKAAQRLHDHWSGVRPLRHDRTVGHVARALYKTGRVSMTDAQRIEVLGVPYTQEDLAACRAASDYRTRVMLNGPRCPTTADVTAFLMPLVDGDYERAVRLSEFVCQIPKTRTSAATAEGDRE